LRFNGNQRKSELDLSPDYVLDYAFEPARIAAFLSGSPFIARKHSLSNKSPFYEFVQFAPVCREFHVAVQL
jgi:hypothetical protein